MLTLCSFGFKSLSCHFGEIYWIELPRTKSSHPTHPVNWIDGVEIICVNCSRFLWCSVLLLFVLVPWTDHQTHLTGMFGPFFSIDLETNLTRSNWPPAHPRSQGNKRACSCVAAKITLLPNNCNWYTYIHIYIYTYISVFFSRRTAATLNTSSKLDLFVRRVFEFYSVLLCVLKLNHQIFLRSLRPALVCEFAFVVFVV